MTDQTGEPRYSIAGFLRRAAAILVDAAVIFIPLQIVVALLFLLTGGLIQGNFGFNTTVCTPLEQLSFELPAPPPEGSNFAVDCRTSLLGFDTARQLKVGRFTQTENSTSEISRSYALNDSGQISEKVWNVDWVAMLIFFSYLIGLETRSGATLGKRMLGIRVVDISAMAQHGIPLRKAIIRRIAFMIGFVPAIIALGGVLVYVSSNDVSGMESFAKSGLFWPVLLISALCILVWLFKIARDMASGNETIYDRIAGTSVLRS